MRKWEVETGLIDSWLASLSDDAYDNVLAALEFLEENGPTVGRPYVDTITGSSHSNMKELRPPKTGAGEVFRVLFAFDMESRAIMLVAGDKAGNWKKWYSKNIPIADGLLADHQQAIVDRRAVEKKKGTKR
ncbi:diaminopimelate decarboxylase [Rhodococcus erythropolis]|uniref:type II toxin-antitoxin system RelE/ParE family toxin n=1 Tax=Rhodococcus erythropolis TaxID=1833 RepID=UPI001C9A7447|nr:type II toxin-antitoxin system RelE/ParE family toxin [Rhodococcus erythropolis]MBY6388585.1 diaminopimelate decarboxylase [Rhodococcus erythropolis]